MMTIKLRMQGQRVLLAILTLLFFPAYASSACPGATTSAATYCVYNSGTGVVGGSVDSADTDPNFSLVATSMYPLEHFFANSITKASQAITFPGLSGQAYGTADIDPGATTSSGLMVSYSSDAPSVATIINGKIHIVGVGTTAITASQAGDGYYSAATEALNTLTVNQAELTISADNKEKSFNSANPDLTWSASGLVNGDTVAVLSGAPLLATTAALDSLVGTYPIQITAGSLAAANYSLAFTEGSLTINKTVPDAPTNVTATGGDGNATVSFIPPASNGGTAIFGYTVTSTPNEIVASGMASPIAVTGLNNGVAYTFTVTATNSQGAGAISAPSNSITPLATTTTTATSTTTTVTTTSSTNVGSTTTTITPPPGQPNSTIRIYTPDGEKQEYYSISDTMKLQANYRDAEGLDVDARPLANWISSDSLIAEVGQGVSKGGTVTFKGNGEVRIFTFLNGLMDYMDFKVGANVSAKHHGNLIILAGGKTNDDSDLLKPAIQYLCNRIYQVFKIRMFKDEDIYYINSDTDQDFNGDGTADGIVDQSIKSVETLHAAMQWAAAEENDGPLYLYLIDHGDMNGTFRIDSNQILTSAQLDAMLDEFEVATGRTTVVMVEACYSGSFVEKLRGSKQRMIITSSSQEEPSFFSSAGTVSFGQFFSNRLLVGDTWEDAFDKAVDEMTKIGAPYSEMKPQKWIGGEVTMGKVYGDFSMGNLFPEIKSYTQSAKLNAELPQEFVVTLDTTDSAGVSVWAMVTPPNYQPPKVSEEFATPALGLAQFELLAQQNSPVYSGNFTFPCGGTYIVTYYAKDRNGMVVSAPQQPFTVSGTDCPFTTQIAPAWNLLSLPVTPADPAVDKVLAGLKGTLTSVWKWENNNWAVSLPTEQDGGTSYADNKGFSLLTTINPGEGFWVNSTNGVALTVSGPPASGQLTLASGWNLVGVKAPQTIPIMAVTAANPGLLSIWKWDDGTWAVHLPGEETPGAYAQSKGFGNLTALNPGEGFWVNKP